MKRVWARLERFVPTRTAAVSLFALALVVYWLHAAGWPMAKGRDTWDYLGYYLQILDSGPPLDKLQLFRTPLTPLLLGVPLDLAGSFGLEVVFGFLYAAAVVGWSATALVFGRLPALLAAALLLVYPAWATLYHQASSDAIFATGLALWALLLARALERPAAARFAAVGAGIAVLVLIRPANQVLLPVALAPLLLAVPWRRRFAFSAACLAAAVGLLGGWAVHNGIRYDDMTVARGGRAWVPFLRVWLADKTIAPENGSDSARLARLIRQEVLAEEPHASLDTSLEAYLAHGSNYETVRLIAKSDEALGEGENYGVLFGSALEAIRDDPGTYLGGVADVFGEFLVQEPLREDVAPRPQTDPGPPPPKTYESAGAVLPNPAANVLVEGVPYGFVWCASDYIDSCTLLRPELVWSDRGRQRRYVEIVAQIRRWDADLPSREGVSYVDEVLNRITPRFPRPPFWIAIGLIGLAFRRPRGWRTVLVLWACAAAVLLVHAASQGVAPEFALPLYPLFIVTGLIAVAGERLRPRPLASSG